MPVQNFNAQPGQRLQMVASPVSDFNPPPNGTPGLVNTTDRPTTWAPQDALTTISDVAADGLSAVVNVGTSPGVSTVRASGTKPNGDGFNQDFTVTIAELAAIGFIFTATVL